MGVSQKYQKDWGNYTSEEALRPPDYSNKNIEMSSEELKRINVIRPSVKPTSYSWCETIIIIIIAKINTAQQYS